jgi:hypothetical protein
MIDEATVMEAIERHGELSSTAMTTLGDDGGANSYTANLGIDLEGLTRAARAYGNDRVGLIAHYERIIERIEEGENPAEVAMSTMIPPKIAAWLASAFTEGFVVGATVGREHDPRHETHEPRFE